MEPRIVIFMGVSGSGKTTVGRLLASDLGWSFIEADDFHPPASRAKMRGGVPLTDEDRAPWLATLRAHLSATLTAGGHAVLACSALSRAHREALVPEAASADAVAFVHLAVPASTLAARLARREDHFFDPDLLDSQLATIEPLTDGLTVDGDQPPDVIVQRVRDALHLGARESWRP